MTGTLIGAIVVATVGLAKEAVSQYGKYRTEKTRGRRAVIVAVAGLGVAVIAATPKAIELYRAHRAPARIEP
jgi:multisubunit Na+/H+ antiporter MnhB subunit